MQISAPLSPWLLGPIPIGVLALMLLAMLEAGWRLRQRHGNQSEAQGLGAVDGAVFSLMGLLVAFTFSGAAGRFDERRAQVVQEANAVGTAYLRLDLLPESPRAALQEQFRQYVDERLATYRAIPDMVQVSQHLNRSIALQGEIWKGAVKAASETLGTPAPMLLLPALNEMIDITSTRMGSAEMHPPAVIFAMLIGLTLASALLAGYGMGGNAVRSWTHIVGFAVVLSLAIYLIVEIEYPRVGRVQESGFDHYLVDVRAGMK